MKTEPNQSAFPSPDSINPFDGSRHAPLNTGLTIREHFAAVAMQGMLSNSGQPDGFQAPYLLDESKLSVHAVRYADALISALNEKEEQQ